MMFMKFSASLICLLDLDFLPFFQYVLFWELEIHQFCPIVYGAHLLYMKKWESYFKKIPLPGGLLIGDIYKPPPLFPLK